VVLFQKYPGISALASVMIAKMGIIYADLNPGAEFWNSVREPLWNHVCVINQYRLV